MPKRDWQAVVHDETKTRVAAIEKWLAAAARLDIPQATEYQVWPTDYCSPLYLCERGEHSKTQGWGQLSYRACCAFMLLLWGHACAVCSRHSASHCPVLDELHAE